MTKSSIKLSANAVALVLLSAAIVTAGETPKPASPARTKDNVEFVIGPDYVDAPELAVKPDAPVGIVHEFTMNSEDSKIYPGIAKKQPGVVPYKRRVAVYVPKQYQPGTPVP